MTPNATIVGAYTCASTEELTAKFEKAFEQALQTRAEETFTVNFCLNFVDSEAKMVTLQMLKAFRHIHTSSSQCNIHVDWVSPKNDSDIAELGMIAQETSSLPFAFQTA